MKIKLLLFLFFIFEASANYRVGSGSVYNFASQDVQNTELSIYITDSSFTNLGIEYFFSTKSELLPFSMWQQFQMILEPGKPLHLVDGYLQTSEMKKPQIMPKEMLNINQGGVQLSDFLFAAEAELNPYLIGEENIEIPAGSIKAKHYRKTRDKQTVDFWISELALPIGLVKLESKGEKPDHNYVIELKNLAENIKKKIDPIDATALDEEGKKFLQKMNFK
ncbi:MAG: hypothetical protein JNM93_12810 [Bacteriovoracaceae bacterium]|nr:hypothetical protein [Bacteriovoracaceae bacterium]